MTDTCSPCSVLCSKCMGNGGSECPCQICKELYKRLGDIDQIALLVKNIPPAAKKGDLVDLDQSFKRLLACSKCEKLQHENHELRTININALNKWFELNRTEPEADWVYGFCATRINHPETHMGEILEELRKTRADLVAYNKTVKELHELRNNTNKLIIAVEDMLPDYECAVNLLKEDAFIDDDLANNEHLVSLELLNNVKSALKISKSNQLLNKYSEICYKCEGSTIIPGRNEYEVEKCDECVDGLISYIPVHESHCCYKHGCKYNPFEEAACPVQEGVVNQLYPCEQCEEELEETPHIPTLRVMLEMLKQSGGSLSMIEYLENKINS